MTSEHNARLKTYGRRGGRPLSARQRHLMQAVLPRLQVPSDVHGAVDPQSLFSQAREVWLEIGTGGGEHVSGQAMRNPEIGLLASEVFLEGIAKLLGQIEDQGLCNIRLWPEDARLLIDALAPGSIDRAFILFPDPWPKARHQKRRLVQPDFLTAMARCLKPGAGVRFATDVRSYADAALCQFLQHPDFVWKAHQADDWRQPPKDHITTRYQDKGLGDIAPVYYEFVRMGAPAGMG